MEQTLYQTRSGALFLLIVPRPRREGAQGWVLNGQVEIFNSGVLGETARGGGKAWCDHLHPRADVPEGAPRAGRECRGTVADRMEAPLRRGVLGSEEHRGLAAKGTGGLASSLPTAATAAQAGLGRQRGLRFVDTALWNFGASL